ncbi:MAG TPA: NAD(P)H-hydrate epimerase [Tepidisphaeraceae bacterium]|jgi:NAD(P)H-hydrate epimerase|nr:NAD(P)H-hydrate epimerase [Tepidisphaeraceae bacterium]
MLRLTRAQLREIDRRATEEFHIPGVVLMENAARAATRVACAMLTNDCGGDVLVLCGGGNNGGDGLALARHLHNRGADVAIALAVDPSRYQGDALVNWQIVSAMKLSVVPATPRLIERSAPSLIVDAIFGTGLTDAPRDPFGAIAAAVARKGVPVLAIDIPSGLDCDTGIPPGACIRATRTVTFVAQKAGFANPDSSHYTGEITVGDIGCPRELIETVARPR